MLPDGLSPEDYYHIVLPSREWSGVVYKTENFSQGVSPWRNDGHHVRATLHGVERNLRACATKRMPLRRQLPEWADAVDGVQHIVPRIQTSAVRRRRCRCKRIQTLERLSRYCFSAVDSVTFFWFVIFFSSLSISDIYASSAFINRYQPWSVIRYSRAAHKYTDYSSEIISVNRVIGIIPKIGSTNAIISSILHYVILKFNIFH